MTAAKHAMTFQTKSVFWLAITVLALSGCTSNKAAAPATASSAPTTTTTALQSPAPSEKAGSGVVTDDVNGFSVRLPTGYTRITDKAMLQSMLKAGTVKDRKLRAVLEQYAPVVERARVFAFKPGTTNFADNVNILAVSPEGMDAEHIGDAYNQVKPVLEEKLGAVITGHRTETVAGTKALRVEYRVKMGPARVRGTQVYLIPKDKLLVVTITQNDVEASSADANMIIDGLRVT